MLIQFSLYPQEHNQGSPTMSDKKNANENHHNDPLSKSQVFRVFSCVYIV